MKRPKTISGYLVIGRCTMDDVPLAFFSCKKRAVAFAKKVDAEYIRAWGSDINFDVTTPLYVAIVPFVCGTPRTFFIVKELPDA